MDTCAPLAEQAEQYADLERVCVCRKQSAQLYRPERDGAIERGRRQGFAGLIVAALEFIGDELAKLFGGGSSKPPPPNWDNVKQGDTNNGNFGLSVSAVRDPLSGSGGYPGALDLGLIFFAQATDSNNWRTVAACAADFGNKYSIASGISAITGVSRTNPVLGVAFGNDASSISDIVTGRNRLGATISEILSNPGSKNVLSLTVRAVGAVPTGAPQTAELGTNGAGEFFVRQWKTPNIAGTVLGKTAGTALSMFTKYKAIYDLSVYGIGWAKCW